MDFLKAQKLENEKATITFGRKSYVIPRQRLGGHYALEATMTELRDRMDTGLYNTVDCYLEWMAYATDFSEEWLDQQDPLEFAEGFSNLVELNKSQANLQWMVVQPKKSKTSADYPNRNLAAIISRIAEAFHWPEDEILNLVPEVAWCYVQEILLSEHDRREFEYSLSEVAYDKHGRYKEFRKPPWYRKLEGGTTIPSSLKPTGNVVDLTKEHRDARPTDEP